MVFRVGNNTAITVGRFLGIITVSWDFRGWYEGPKDSGQMASLTRRYRPWRNGMKGRKV